MSTTPYPLTDETRDLLVGHIAHGTIDCSSEEGRCDSLTAADARGIVDSLWGPMVEAAFDAGRKYERQDSDLGRATVAPGATKVDAPLREGEVREQIVTNDIGEWVNVETRANGYGFLHLGCGHMMNLDRETRAALSAALAEDARPWEPLSDDEPLNVGDEVRQDYCGITHTAVVGSVDKDGDPWTTEDGFIGHCDLGTWYVRRAVQELPPERDGVVLVPADGREGIGTTDGQVFARLTFTTKQSIWYGPNLAAQLGDWVIQTTSPSRLVPGTWKVEGE